MLEHLTGHAMGPSGRELVAEAAQLAPVTGQPDTGSPQSA